MATTLHNFLIAPFLLITPELINSVLAELIEENEEFIADLNRAQLQAGIRADGSKITPPYTPYTRRQKAGNGQPYDRVTLKDTGSFYDKLFVDVFSKSFIIGDTDPKAQDLRDKYGELILGLTAENKQRLIDRIRPLFVIRLRAKIGLS